MLLTLLQTNVSAPPLNESSVACFAQGTEGTMSQCVLDGVFSAGPSPSLIGLGIGSVVLVSFYIASEGHIAAPAAMMILFGGILVPMLPPQFVGLAYMLAVVGTAALIFQVYTRFTEETGF